MGEKAVSLQTSPFGDNEIERIRQILYFQFQYIQRLYLKKYDDSWTDIVSNISSWEDPDLGSDTIRYVCCAILNRNFYDDSSYDLNKVPECVFKDYYKFIELSTECGYYLNDILAFYPSFELIQFIGKYKTTPLPPIPFVGGKRNTAEKIATTHITRFLLQLAYHPVSQKDDSDINEKANEQYRNMIKNEVYESVECDDKIDTFTARMFIKDWERFISSNKIENSTKEIENYKDVFKKFANVTYRRTSLESRAAGLFLWDHVKANQKSKKEAIALLRKHSNKLDKINNKSDQALEEILNGTVKCIEAGAVLRDSVKSADLKKK